MPMESGSLHPGLAAHSWEGATKPGSKHMCQSVGCDPQCRSKGMRRQGQVPELRSSWLTVPVPVASGVTRCQCLYFSPQPVNSGPGLALGSRKT